MGARRRRHRREGHRFDCTVGHIAIPIRPLTDVCCKPTAIWASIAAKGITSMRIQIRASEVLDGPVAAVTTHAGARHGSAELLRQQLPRITNRALIEALGHLPNCAHQLLIHSNKFAPTHFSPALLVEFSIVLRVEQPCNDLIVEVGRTAAGRLRVARARDASLALLLDVCGPIRQPLPSVSSKSFLTERMLTSGGTEGDCRLLKADAAGLNFDGLLLWLWLR